MSLRKRPVVTAKMLAANVRNAKRSTGPRTRRGRAFSRLNGWKGGRPSKSRYPFEVSEDWQPDMNDPDFRTWVLDRLREEYPEAYAIWMRCSPEDQQRVQTEREGLRDEADSNRMGPQKVFRSKTDHVDNK